MTVKSTRLFLSARNFRFGLPIRWRLRSTGFREQFRFEQFEEHSPKLSSSTQPTTFHHPSQQASKRNLSEPQEQISVLQLYLNAHFAFSWEKNQQFESVRLRCAEGREAEHAVPAGYGRKFRALKSPSSASDQWAIVVETCEVMDR